MFPSSNIPYMKTNKTNKQQNSQSASTKQKKSQAKTVNDPYYKANPQKINQLKQYLFPADLGHFYKFTSSNKLYFVKRVRRQVGIILMIADMKLSFQKTQAFVTSQYNNVKYLSDKIDQTLALRKKQTYINPELNRIQNNYFLKYMSIKCDFSYGCFVYHQPILITLDQLLKSGKLTYQQKLQIFSEILNIMQFLQTLNICHRSITSFCFVFVPKDAKIFDDPQFNYKKWKYNKQQCILKISGFYQSTYVGQQQHPNIIFQNIYTDPHIHDTKPSFVADLWSIMIIFYQMMTGKIPHLNKTSQLESQMSSMLKWQRDLFTNVFRGTNNIKLTLKDLKMRVKNMTLTSFITTKIIENNKRVPDEKQSFFNTISRLENTSTRRRAFSQFRLEN